MLTTFCSTSDSQLHYRGKNIYEQVSFALNDLGRSFKPTVDRRPYSTCVEQLSRYPWAEPHHIAHLAGYINKLYPHIDWDWESQLLDIEYGRRHHKYYPEYIKERCHGRVPEFLNDFDYQDHMIKATNFIKRFEPDEAVQERVRKLMAQWITTLATG
jgi:hypothetical protein